MYRVLRPLLFKLDPEAAHTLTLNLVRLAGLLPPARFFLRRLFFTPQKPLKVFGLRFTNPVGLAAGYDKDALALGGLAALGFGHIEVGTVTPRPQPGNPRPRIFRLVEDQAVINRMGFPGRGAQQAALSLRRASSLQGRRCLPVLGVNIGKNKDTPLENAAEDYIYLLNTFAPLADYFAVNISSPNTLGLRRLQGGAMLAQLLAAIQGARASLPENKPVLVKLAPDLSPVELDDALDVILSSGMDGVIAANTTLARDGLLSSSRDEIGGLSGRPLTSRADAFLDAVVARLQGHLPVISVGGIMSPDDAKRRLDHGAALVQVYTGLIYAGPGLVKRIVQAL